MLGQNKPARFWKWLDRYLGRGSYLWMRPILAPYQEDTHAVYAETLSRMVGPGIRWLDAGCGHKVLARYHEEQEREIVARPRLAIGCDTFSGKSPWHRSLNTIVACDLGHLPFADASFDLVTLNMVAEHLADRTSVMNPGIPMDRPGTSDGEVQTRPLVQHAAASHGRVGQKSSPI